MPHRILKHWLQLTEKEKELQVPMLGFVAKGQQILNAKNVKTKARNSKLKGTRHVARSTEYYGTLQSP
jgi:hypothetical protein